MIIVLSTTYYRCPTRLLCPQVKGEVGIVQISGGMPETFTKRA
ncbi:hypothetical protein SAMN06309944_0494 [Micrococcales bacterium KH10]|nr:hypothetical protein SAMN06309944_0494 [Micrococcales bacterium KH10]